MAERAGEQPVDGEPFDVVSYPAPILYQRATEVELSEITDEFRATLRRMFATMYEERGVGLAAPQVGISKRFFIANEGPAYAEDSDDELDDDASDEGAGEELVFINPEILEPAGSQLGEEGCLSIRGVTGTVDRAETLRVRALDENGEPFEMEAEGYLARIIQHETDHLDGKLFIDKISPAEKLLAEKQLKHLRAVWEKENGEPKRSGFRRGGMFGRRGGSGGDGSPAKKRRLKRR